MEGASEESASEQATPRKLERARRAGVVARSGDLVAASALLAGVGALIFVGPGLWGSMRALVVRGLGAAAALDVGGPELLAAPLQRLAWLAAVPLAAAASAAWLAGFVQVGPLFASELLTPGLRKPQFGALFAPGRLLDLGWTALKVCALGLVAALNLESSARAVLSLYRGRAPHAWSTLLAATQDLIVHVAFAALLIGVADLVYRRVRRARQLRMGRRELAFELREHYGVPELRERRRQLQLEARARAASVALENATVLLLDGRGRALALAFDAADSAQRAPRVAAKAEAALAQRLRIAAEQHAIPVRLHPGLVAMLFALELTEEVPPACYEALAEIMRELDSQAS
jgi:flagellar biosynthetic protein FlhB